MEQLLSVLGWIGSAVFVVFFVGLCIFVHELGHFLVAKWRGLHIDAFALGFRKIWSKKINGVEYRIGWLPFGGYVELPQVDSSEAHPKAADGTELEPAKPIDRILTAVAGPTCNIIFGLFLACFIWIFGMPMSPDSAPLDTMRVIEVTEGSPEYQAGLRPGDEIVTLNGEKFSLSWTEFIQKVMLSPGLQVDLGVDRGGELLDIRYTASLADHPKKPERMQFEGMPWPFFSINQPVEIHPAADSPLTLAGIRPGELIVAVNGRRHEDIIDFIASLQNIDPPWTFTVLRDDREVEIGPVQVPRGELLTYRIGISFDPEAPEAVIAAVTAEMPAGAAGLKAGDRITAVNGQPAPDTREVQKLIREYGEGELTVSVLRDGEEHAFAMTAKPIYLYDIKATLERIGHPTPFEQLKSTVKLSYDSLRGMIIFLGNKLGLTETTSAIKPRNMSGIVGIAQILFQASGTSFMMGLYFVVVVSFALAIFNLLPLPVLDGGHIFFAFLELIFRRPVPRVVVRYLSYLFVALLIGFMIYVTVYDVWRAGRSIGFLP